MEAKYPTYGKPNPKAEIHVCEGYPRWHWWDSSIRNNRYKLIHVWVWEQHHGPVPEGHDIHHKNQDRADYRIENLELVTHGDHRKVHAEMKFEGGGKTCTRCKVWKPLTSFRRRSGRGLYSSECLDCKKVLDKAYREGPKREARLAKKREYAAINCMKERARARAWYEKNREKVLERMKGQRSGVDPSVSLG